MGSLNTALIEQLEVAIDDLKIQAEAMRTQGASVMYLAVDGQPAGLVAVSDPIKASTMEALAGLRASGLRVIMATGDNLTTAKAVAMRLGIDEVHEEVKLADKLALVTRLQQEGRIVAMAGDGINDAPALAKGDVGIAALTHHRSTSDEPEFGLCDYQRVAPEVHNRRARRCGGSLTRHYVATPK